LQRLHSAADDGGRWHTGGLRLVGGRGDELLDYRLQGPTIGFAPGCKISQEFLIERPRLPSGSVQTTVGVKVCVGGNELAFLRHRTNKRKEKGLSRAEVTDDESDSGASVGDSVDISKQGPDFAVSSDLNVLLTCARHNASA
jgi:hypothetical protein